MARRSRFFAKTSYGVTRAIRFLSAGVTLPFRMTAKATAFIMAGFAHWWRTRELRAFLYGLPALVVVLATGFVAVAAAVQDRSLLLTRYQQSASKALAAEQFAAAKLYLERLVQMQGSNSEILFDLARAAQQTKDFPRVASCMHALAPDDRPVFAPAHLWQATLHLNRRPPALKDLQIAETHLLHALKLRPNDIVAHDLLGQLYFQQGLYAQAIPQLAESARQNPPRKFLLAKAYALAGDSAKALRYGQEAREYYARESAGKPQDITLRVTWAEACLFIDEYPEAVRILRDALAIHDDQTVRKTLARSLIAWADSLSSTTNAQRQQQFDLLEKGMQVYPDETLLFDRMMRLLQNDDETSQAAREFLQANIVAGKAIGLSHLLLGAHAFQSKAATEAQFHIERAFESLPQADLIANNFAWLLAFNDPPQLERALSLIEPVIARNATSPRFRDTRGQILLKLGRPKEAIADLELALKTLSENSQTHAALADCYEMLNLVELGIKHRAASKKFAKSSISRTEN